MAFLDCWPIAGPAPEGRGMRSSAGILSQRQKQWDTGNDGTQRTTGHRYRDTENGTQVTGHMEKVSHPFSYCYCPGAGGGGGGGGGSTAAGVGT